MEMARQELELAALRAQQALDQMDSGDLEGVRRSLECILAETRAAAHSNDPAGMNDHLLALEIHVEAEKIAAASKGSRVVSLEFAYKSARQIVLERRLQANERNLNIPS